jgi:hypothetical protein
MNISLDRLDQCVESVRLPMSNHGACRKRYPPSMALLNAARRKTAAGKRDEAKRLRQQAPAMPSRAPDAPHFRRLWYVRYAEDTLRGCSGPRAEAETMKAQLKVFLPDSLKWALSPEKTVITHARTHAARLLGSEVVPLDADEKHDHRGQRCINGVLGLKVPVEVIRAQCNEYMQHGEPIHLAARLHATDYSIVSQSQAEYRGFVPYSLLAFHVHRLWRLHHGMELSRTRTLANKHKRRLSKVYRQYHTTMATPHGTHKVLQVTVPRGEGKKPLVARCGGIALRWQKTAILHDRPKEGDNSRSEIAQRLLAQRCELCGVEEACAVHHIRKLADLHKPGRKDKPAWANRMAMRKRKTLVVCRSCHEAIHYGKPKRHKSVA